MAMKMFKMYFPNTIIVDFYKSIEKKVVLDVYNSSCILQIGICKVAIIQKGIESWCSFFVVARSCPALLGMPDCEGLQLLHINFNTMVASHNRRHVNKQYKQDKNEANNNSKINLVFDGKNN